VGRVKAALAWLVCSAGCGFQSAVPAGDAGRAGDAAPDAAPDTATDAPASGRTRAGLIALWEFDEVGGATVADTGTTARPVPLTIKGSAVFAAGAMTPSPGTVIESAPSPHLNGDVTLARAVTLEAWVTPALAEQGSAAKPVLVAGLSGSIKARNISLLQASAVWVGRIRTSGDANGGPDLTSAVAATAGVLTHLVVVCDASQRMLYIDGQLAASDPVPAAPLQWDNTYPMELGAEHSGSAQWTGTFAMVAMYSRALGPEQVLANYRAGASAR